MLEKNTMIKIKNRDNGTVSYAIPDLHLTRFFQPGEVKEISYEELQRLSYQTGGKYLLENVFILNNEEAVREILGEVEPEYFYSEEDIETLLTTGSLDQLLDCLDFAPTGVIEIIKQKAVSMELNDLSKREAIQNATGLDISKAIEINNLAQEDKTEEKPTGRRTAPVTKTEETSTPTRRTSKYNIVK